jgi:hypothetical protein
MHDFSCAAEKTCLTWAPGGPKKWNSQKNN